MYNIYAERLQKLRKQLKLTQAEIAEKTGITYRAYSSYERGERNPSLEFLAAIEKMYNVNLNWIIAGDGAMLNAAPDTIDSAARLFLRSEILQILKDEGIMKQA